MHSNIQYTHNNLARIQAQVHPRGPFPIRVCCCPKNRGRERTRNAIRLFRLHSEENHLHQRRKRIDSEGNQ